MATQGTDPRAGDGREALVIGASFAGLLGARVLAEHFDRVTLIERDAIHDAPESRKGQPHTRHIHALLPSGYGILRELFEDLDEDLRAGGAIEADMGEGVRFHAGGGFAAQGPTGLRGVFVSRPTLEWRLARRVRRIRNVLVLDRHKVTGLIAAAGRISGVRVIDLGDGEHEEALRADLVVDASGRGSSTPRWLETLGFDAPRETLVKIDLTYTARIYRHEPAGATPLEGIIINPDVPRSPRLGAAFPIEQDRWIVSVGGWGGDQCPLDEQGHREFMHSLAAPDIGELVDGLEPLSDFYRYRFAANRRWHYEKLKRFPGGLLVIGDAVASFNPVYGQGMTSAAFQAKELQRALAGRMPLEALWKPYFKRAARIVDRAWQLAVGADFAFPGTDGPKPPGTDLVNRYVKRLARAAHKDMALVRAFIQVQNLLAPPASLFRPDLAWRVLRPRRSPSAPQSGARRHGAVRRSPVRSDRIGRWGNAMSRSHKFWDRLARRYAKMPVRNQAAYDKKLEVTRRYLRPDMELLEFGCGTGSTAIAHAPYVKHILAIDISAKMLEIAAAKAQAAGVGNIAFERMAIEDLDATGRTYDAVLGLSILHLVENPEAVLDKVHRLLAPDGVFVSSTACAGDVRTIWKVIVPMGAALGLLPQVNFFTGQELEALLEASGFQIDYRFRPSVKEALFIVAKKA